MILRYLTRSEIETIWTIDRREVHHYIYRIQDGSLGLTPAYFEVPGWAPGQVEQTTGLLYACFDRGGAFPALFQDDQLIGAAVIDNQLFGPDRDYLELKMLYVSRDSRRNGVGKRLFAEARAAAQERGARFVYISATPTQNTVEFYQRRGSMILSTPDPERFTREPNDIHLICPV